MANYCIMELVISIHAPHEGERQSSFIASSNDIKISIHAPHEGERLLCLFNIFIMFKFQSTLPTRGSDDIYVKMLVPQCTCISIHAPHEGERLAI